MLLLLLSFAFHKNILFFVCFIIATYVFFKNYFIDHKITHNFILSDENMTQAKRKQQEDSSEGIFVFTLAVQKWSFLLHELFIDKQSLPESLQD